MALTVNQILVICILIVLVAMLGVLGVVAVKGIDLMKNMKAFTEEYERLAAKAELIVDDAKETIHEGAETFSKSLTAIAISSVLINAIGKLKKIKKLAKKDKK